jgi:predicted nucleic acid-binding protein
MKPKLVRSSTLPEPITHTDLQRVHEILQQYAESRLDFVDATVVAIAERQNITRILSLDRRDYTIIRPKHAPYFELLP